MKHLEIKTIEYKGIEVVVKIDYENEEISLVEKQKNSNPSVYTAKNWFFAKRGIEFTNSWLVILDAMKNAITVAKKELEAFQKEQAKKKEDIIIKASIADKKKK